MQGVKHRIGNLLQHLGIWTPLLIGIAHILGFTLYTVWMSFTPSTLVPMAGWVGFDNYQAILATRNWRMATINIGVYGLCFMALTTAIGLTLAILIDQKVRGENALRTIFLYPMAVSFVVTGVVWSWLLNPGLGIQKLVNDLGFPGFTFDWLIDQDRAIYTIAIAGAWQASGFAMALLLAGLRSVDNDLMRAAQIDGASTWRLYRRIVLPSIWPIFIAAFVIQLQFAIKTFDLAIALTGGGPGVATSLPSIVVYDFLFQRGSLGKGSAAAVLMLLYLLVVLVPYGLFVWWRRYRETRNG